MKFTLGTGNFKKKFMKAKRTSKRKLKGKELEKLIKIIPTDDVSVVRLEIQSDDVSVQKQARKYVEKISKTLSRKAEITAYKKEIKVVFHQNEELATESVLEIFFEVKDC